MRTVRTFVLLGQGGALTSGGMISLAGRIRALGGTIVTTHSWDDTQGVARALAATGKSLGIALIGYSLGANSASLIAAGVTRQIDLLIGYDPTRAPGSKAAPIGANVKRAVCYRNPYAWPFGGGYYAGQNVEYVTVNEFHLAVCYDENLHLRTLASIRTVKGA